MTSPFKGDQADLKAAAEKFFMQADTFRNHLGILEGIKQEYGIYVVGSAGTAMQDVWQACISRGNNLHRTFMEVVDALNDSGAKFDHQDQEAAAMVNRHKYDF
ncbi:hypothetical protein AB0M45_31915 [Nocardia sp. NPDC051787]|uniref:WXG100 family type VII secretion target n=1 Tax=Nocardia sp. NPDC051787 TaxID=3155415 RepID=UPI00341B4050